MRCKFPESEIIIQIADFIETTPQPSGWTQMGDGTFWWRLHFANSHTALQFTVMLYMRGDGFIDIDAPGLVMKHSIINGSLRTIIMEPERHSIRPA